ncbi:uncharacterized protein EI90DRAFT_2179235 [Cantharellus anzutake]|uniref:uncharacterized protein n=1 Tax=Cantharellus anzutake TaxID=1750568 RepID=UPI0019055252|nr:uncharacterized protein EI90DRAFT_2179235 [Cantharellus anzutake]KAF8325215.1 hypothetical protein EI90DRAFT_2179235 [Cantharellus anzutake]
MALLSKAQTCPLDVQHIIMSCLTPKDTAHMASTCRNWLYASRERLYRTLTLHCHCVTLKLLGRTLNRSAEIRNFVKFLSISYCERWTLPDWMTLLPAGNVRQVRLYHPTWPNRCASTVLSLPLMNQVHTLSLKSRLWGWELKELTALPNLRRLWLEQCDVLEGCAELQLPLLPFSLSDCRLTLIDVPVLHINFLRSFAANINVTGLLIHIPHESKALLGSLATVLKSSFTTLHYLAIESPAYHGPPIMDDVLPHLPRLTYLMCGGGLYREGVLPDNLSELHLYTDDFEVIQGVLCQLEAKKRCMERSSPSSPGLSLRKFRILCFGRVDHTGLRKKSAELGVELICCYSYLPRANIRSIQRDLEREGNWFPVC